MPNEIIISLKPQFAELICARKKTYEFRKYAPRLQVKKIWVYVTVPVAKLKYVAEVDEPVKYPDKINDDGIGNFEFNEGKKTKYAFKILHFDELNRAITLDELRQFGLIPPQSFVYLKENHKLTNFIRSIKTKRFF